MKKKRFVAYLKTTMKITIAQIFLFALFTCAGVAKHVSAQKILSQQVSLNVNQAEIKDVLNEIQQQIHVVFVYSPSAIEASRKTTIKINKMKLGDVLESTFKPLNISYKLIKNKILLYKESTLLQPISFNNTDEQKVNQVESANQQNVTGTVTDNKGIPLPGVSVLLKGTTIGVATGVDGRFTINAPAETGTLVFTFVGFVTREVAFTAGTPVNIQLLEESKALNEVVVIGYQTVRRRDLTGSTAVISPAEANRVTSNSLGEAIQGLAPGVTVRNGGAPGQQSRIEIRGVASFTNSDPLYVIDGMLADANPTINNDDIESIQILKDASAAAIYGSRAANGVVIITTKKGREGPLKITASAKYGVQQIPNRFDVMNASQYVATKSQQYVNSGVPLPPSLSNPTGVNTNWQDAILRTGNDQDYNVTLSGGTNTSNYLISGSYYQNKGILTGTDFNRSSLRINTETKKGRFSFGENVLLTSTNNKYPNRGNAISDMGRLLPNIPIQDPRFITGSNPGGWSTGTNDIAGVPTGSQPDVTYAYNSVAINQLSQGSANYGKIVGNAYAQLRLFDWLNYRFNTGLEVSYDYLRDLRLNGIFSYAQQPELSYINENRSRFTNLLLEHTLNFNKTFGAHNINGVVGYTQQSVRRTFTEARRNDLQIYNGQYLTSINSATGASSANGGSGDYYKLRGFLGRLNYTYGDRYLLTLTGRDDQDSRFGEAYRNGFFPSVAAAWRISKEKFFKADWVDDLKLNASYGSLGVTTIGNSFAYVGVINNSPRAVFGPQQIPYVGAYQAGLVNENLHWEKRIVKNIGVDASFLNSKLTVSVAGYNSLGKDVLVPIVLGQFLGNSGANPPVNAASIRNTGFEFAATYRNNDHPFKWDVSGNFTTIKNEVIALGNQGNGVNYLQQDITRTQIGRSIGEWYVLKADGLFQSQAEINNYKNSAGVVIQPQAKPGDVKYVDQNGDGQINTNDRTFSGSPFPKLQTGAQFNASYKQFTLNLQLVGVFGVKLFNSIRQIQDTYQNTNFRSDISPWTPQNTNTSDARLALATNDPGVASNNLPYSSRWLENGSYGRIRNLEIGYQLPANFLKSINVTNARFYVSGQNLLTVTKYKGLDPDVVGNGILQRGYDNGNYPPSRVFSIGFNCGF
jgi:TonB-linked SusC/RagA family outer membrane protein